MILHPGVRHLQPWERENVRDGYGCTLFDANGEQMAACLSRREAGQMVRNFRRSGKTSYDLSHIYLMETKEVPET